VATKEPPAANVAPAAKLPEVRAPVVKVKDPRFPTIKPPPLKPLRPMSLDPARLRVLLVLVICPPELRKLKLFAMANRGKARARVTTRAAFRGMTFSGAVAFSFRPAILGCDYSDLSSNF
jgi:hypothetical protein